MMDPKFTYNNTYRAFYEKVYDILIEHLGAQAHPFDKENFVSAFTQKEHTAIEWRFSGLLGFGGKFWRNGGFYVNCYPEDKTKKRQALIEKANALIAALVEEMHPNPDGP
jgi:hypothetical protein